MPVSDLFGNKEEIAMERMRMFEPPEGYWLAFSGGKDSVVLYDLAKRSGVKFEAHFSVTTVDPPELYRFIRQHYPEVAWERPAMTMYKLIEMRGFPLRRRRHCCAILKEGGGDGRRVLTGIRWAESLKRSKRKPHAEDVKAGDGAAWVEQCRQRKHKTYVHPIIDWTDKEVWAYIHARNVPYCSLYDEGCKRIGCVMCPNAGLNGMQRDAARWPRIAAAYRRAFHKLWERNPKYSLSVIHSWKSADDMFEWWIGNAAKEDIELPLFDEQDVS